MEEVLNFLRDNWSFLVEVFLTLVVLLIALFKKKVSVNVPQSVFRMIPSFIEDAEKLFGSGEGKQKLRYVVECCVKYVQDILNIDVSKNLVVYTAIVEQVEQILSTPKKKEIEE